MTASRVLLVEDEPGYARFLREVLLETHDEYDVTSASTLEEGLACLEQSSFHVVLLDLGLPDADGTEALKTVLAAAPSPPIVVLSALSDLDVAIESMRLGAQEYLVKGQAEHFLLPRAVRYAIERKRLQDVAAAARAEAVQANVVKDEFLAMLGHELRNPLAPIVTGLSLIKRHGVPEIARELSVVERQVHHVVRLVDDLLDVARIARGKMLLQLSRLDLAGVVAASAEAVEPLLEEKHQSLTIDLPTGLLFVDGDGGRLAQVVANLLTNAAKYSASGGAISVRGTLEGSFVELRVRDNGIGMTPELISRIFELFEQGERLPDRSDGGLGLGLAIVQNIVRLHGGTVHATSDGPGKGSELVVRLPIATQTISSDAVHPRRHSVEPAPARKVLIVDDNEDGAELLALSLSHVGHTTHVAKDGPTALAAIGAFHPDVALLDIGLPILDGYEVARLMRASLGDRTPILVALTGYGRDTDRARSRAAGFDYHLVKPVDMTFLHELIAGDLTRPR